MKKILGIVAALVLCAATASASPMTVTTGPPDDAQVAVGNANATIFMGDDIGMEGPRSVAGDIELWFFMNTGQDEVGFIHNAMGDTASFAYTGPNIGAMGVSDLANAGKMDGMAALLGANVAVLAHTGAEVIHGDPPTSSHATVRGHNA